MIDLDVTQETAEDSNIQQQPERRRRGRPRKTIEEELKDHESCQQLLIDLQEDDPEVIGLDFQTSPLVT